MLLKVGFSGGIASGKTARCNHLVSTLASNRFSRVKLLSADHIAHQTYLPGTDTYYKLIDRFGPSIITPIANAPTEEGPPPINRRELGQIVFNDDVAMRNLNAIVWPAVKVKISDEIESFESKIRRKKVQDAGDRSILICEAALLTEIGMATLFDEVWLLGCSTEEAIKRIMHRDGLDEIQARARIASQLPFDERRQLLEAEGFVTSTASDNGNESRQQELANATKILRTFDTTNHSTLADGISEIDIAFSAMTRKWIGK
eukprot:GILI01019256.1.p1 GENE.GILI01019256.1~~GILI01019256.1.p1  ORF type:complete len:292 (-),score=41.27 GILI01019256.1:120-899(-)